MIETIENVEGVLQEQGSLTGNIVEDDSINGNLDSVGNIIKERDVNFYDYDGSLVYSYNADEFLNMFAFPANPKHRGLISEGWNWSLGNAREYVMNYGKLDLGQLYNVEGDGALIGITLTDTDLRGSWNSDSDYDEQTGIETYYYSYIMTLYLPLEDSSDDKYVIVDWGDGSEPDKWYGIDDYSSVYISHIYDSIGDYEIKITPINDAIFCVEPKNDECKEVVKYAHLGKNEKLIRLSSYNYFFQNCSKLEYLTTLDDYYNLEGCYNLKTIIYPRDVEEVIIEWGFVSSLTNLILSDTITNIQIRNDGLRKNSIKNIYIPMNWKTIYFILTSNINNIIIPDNQHTGSDDYRVSIKLNESKVNYMRLPRILYSSTFSYSNSIDFYNSVISSEVILPINISSDNLSTLSIENTYMSEYLYIPPGITKLGSNTSYSDYYNYKIRNDYITEDIEAGSFKVIDFRNHTQVPTLQASTYFRDPLLRYVIVPDNLIDEWRNATNWSNLYYQYITASDYEAIHRRGE